MAKQQGYLLSEDDVKALAQLVREHKRRTHNPRLRSVYGEGQPPSSSTYIALSPPGGIPALSEGPDTGTAFGGGDQPGYGECQVYQIIDNGGVGELVIVDGFTLTAYNLASSAIPGDSWCLLHQDAYGFYEAQEVAPGGSGGGGSGVALQEVNGGSDSVAAAATIQNDYASGLDLVPVSGTVGKYFLLAASMSQAGTVNLISQAFAGLKSFADGAYVNNRFRITVNLFGSPGNHDYLEAYITEDYSPTTPLARLDETLYHNAEATLHSYWLGGPSADGPGGVFVWEAPTPGGAAHPSGNLTLAVSPPGSNSSLMLLGGSAPYYGVADSFGNTYYGGTVISGSFPAYTGFAGGLYIGGNGVVGTVTVGQGGTGQTTLSSGQLLYGNGTGAVQTTSNARVQGGKVQTKVGTNLWAQFGSDTQ